MLTLTNDKIAGFEPRWAPFRGFSLLFDNPDDSFARTGARLDLAGADRARGASFYRDLHGSVSRLGRDFLLNTSLLCLLPPGSYHVTVADGVNDGNVNGLAEEYRPSVRELLAGLPDSLGRAHVLTDLFLSSPLVADWDEEVRLQLGALANWSDISVVAELVPADPASASALGRLTAERARLLQACRERFGLATADPGRFVPHVTLGYFANREWARGLSPRLPEWLSALAGELLGFLSFRRVSLYGFTDMASFFKQP
jgi:hypothetical protein